MRLRPALPLLALPLLLLARPTARGEDPAVAPIESGDHARDVAPFFARWCAECHAYPGSETDLSVLSSEVAARAAPNLLRLVRRRLAAGEMPPEEEEQPPEAEREAALRWIAAATPEPPAPRVALRRLNRVEYDRCVQDLLGVAANPGREFPRDDVGHGFDTVGDVLGLSPLLVEKLHAAAEAVAAEALLVWSPVKLRVEGEACRREGSDGNTDDQGLVWLYSEGELLTEVTVPITGEYVLRARACGDQAGPEPVKMAFRVDRRRAARVDVRALRDAPETFSTKVRLEAGRRTIGLAFTNDYYRPEDPDPAQRDRNMGVDWLELEGPAEAPALSPFHARVEPLFPAASDDPRPAARAILRPLLRRAWRARPTQEELEPYVKLVAATIEQGEPFARGLQVALEALLCSPRFLFRVELDPDPGSATVHPVTELELAARLSFFLWSSLPDERLLDLAESGTLRSGLRDEVLRMLDDPRASALAEHFAGQWLQLRRLEEVTPDPVVYPDFDEELRAAMRAETELLFEAVLREDRGALDLIGAPFTFVNGRLARHYGIAGVEGPRFRRVVAPRGRGGVLGHASLLTVSSNPTRTSPVKRGKLILEELLFDPPPPPLPGADSFPEGKDAERKATLRERLMQHRADPTCASCHARMDPLGLGLERFDGIGAWRDRDEQGRPIDDKAELPRGEVVDGPDGLRRHLLGKGPVFVQGLLSKLLVYGVGRGPAEVDEAELAEIVARTGPSWRMKTLIAELVESKAFQTRRGER